MQKPLLGIVAVICLHIGFTIYTATDSPSDTALNTDRPATEIYPAPGASTDATPGTPDGAVSMAAADAKGVLPKDLTKRSTRRRKDGPAFNLHALKKDRMAPAAYPSNNYASRKPSSPGKRDSGKADDERRADRRPARKKDSASNGSFIAKVVPILKKPYDWLKAIGSKLR